MHKKKIADKYKPEGVGITGIHDDLYFHGPWEPTIRAFKEYGELLKKECGVSRNIQKTKVLRGEHLASWVDELMSDSRCCSDGLIAVGTPVGTTTYIETQAEMMFDKFSMILEDVSGLPPQLAIPLLNNVISSRPNHTARCINPDILANIAEIQDRKVDDAIAKICRVSGGTLDSTARTIRGLPTKKGGLGIRRLEELRWDAYFAGYSNFLRFYKENDPDFLETWLIELENKMIHLLSNVFVPDDSSDSDNLKQKDYARCRYAQQLTNLLFELSDDDNRLRKAWFLSSSQPGCAAWLYSALQGPHLRLNSSQYREALRLRLLEPVIENEPNRRGSCTCGYCKDDQTDGFMHGHLCRTANIQRTFSHDSVVKALFDFLTKTVPDGHWRLEQNVGHSARADVVGNIEHQVFWVDVAITCPCTIHALAKRSDLYPLTAARIREKQKLEHYENARQATPAPAVTVVPFVMESTGALGTSATDFIDTVCKLPRLLPIADSTLAIHRRNFKKLINVCVARGLAESVRAARRAFVSIPITNSDVTDNTRTSASSPHTGTNDAHGGGDTGVD